MSMRATCCWAWFLFMTGWTAWAQAEWVIIVHPQNSINNLSPEQARNLFLGRDTHFPDGHKAHPIDLPPGREREAFYLRVTGKNASQIKSHWAKLIFTGKGQSPQEAHDGSTALTWVATDPEAIGYLDKNQWENASQRRG